MKDTPLANMFAGIEAKLVEQVAFTKQAMESQNEFLHNLFMSHSIESRQVLNARETAYMLDVSEDHLYRLTSQRKSNSTNRKARRTTF